MSIKLSKDIIICRLKERNEKYPTVTPYKDWEYSSVNQIFTWECEFGHTWDAPIKRILKGHGCKVCSMKNVGKTNESSIDELYRKVSERNVLFHDKKVELKIPHNYRGMTKKCTWVCSNGHEWDAIPKTIVRGSYCPECKRLDNIQRQTDDSFSVSEKIKRRNERIPLKRVHIHPFETYKDRGTKLMFVCDNKHIWKGNIGDVINNDSGCPICAKSGYSLKAIEWLETISKIEDVVIQHAKNLGEYNIPNTKLKVDGFCKDQNTVYEFYGDYWHGNPITTNSDEMNSSSKTTFGELYYNTLQREKVIRELGYNLITIWESEYDHIRNK